MIKYVQVNRHFDIPRLQAEVNALLSKNWQQHYNAKHFEGDWSVLPLRSINGTAENTLSISPRGNDHIRYADTPLLEEADYLKEVLNWFACEKTAVRLMRLKAGSVIKEHTDHEINFENGEARFHIPVFTNDKLAFYVADEQVVMKEGECWYLNLILRHRVTNGGDTDRIHLVVDCLVNDWVKTQLLSNAIVSKETDSRDEEPVYSDADKRKIIEQLRTMNTAAATALADKMESGL